MIRILLVDDQNLVQQGIKSLLDRDLELKVIGTVEDGRSAVREIEYLRPDIVLLDIEMPGMNGITATKYISRLSPRTKVIILSSHEDKKYVTQALMAGAKGYILKSTIMSDLKQAIIAVNNGYSQIDSRLLAKVFDPSNLKPKKRQANSKKVKNTSNQIKDNQKILAESKNQILETKSAVQNPDLLDLELEELDLVSTPSQKYQLGTSSVDATKIDSISKIQLPPKTSETDTIEEIIKTDDEDSEISERDTFSQNRSYHPDLLELDTVDTVEANSSDLVSPSQDTKEDLGNDIQEFFNLKKGLPETKSDDLDNLDDLPKRSRQKLAPIPDLSLDDPKSESYSLADSRRARGTRTMERLTSKPDTSQRYLANLTLHRPLRKSKQSKLKKLLRKSLEYSWLWNVILIVAGAVVVIIIGNL